MYFLKLDNIEKLSGNRVIVTVGANSFVVSSDMIEQPPSRMEIMKQLTYIVGATLVIKESLGQRQPPDLSPQPVLTPAKAPVAAPDREASVAVPAVDPVSLGLASGSAIAPPFQVNEDCVRMPLPVLGEQLGALYESDPSQRRGIIQRVAGMIRLDMLAIKEYLPHELRRSVVGQLMRRDALKTGVIPPDLAAFSDDRPLHETLGSRSWDPGSDRAKDSVSPGWAESERVLNKIAAEVGESEFAHMYPTTASAAVEVNRKFSAPKHKEG